MGALWVAISHELAVTWPKMIGRAGCEIQSLRVDSSQASRELLPTNLKEFTSGSVSYWVCVLGNNARVNMAFLKGDTAASRELCVFCPGEQNAETVFLETSLLYMMISSGGRPTDWIKSKLRNIFIFCTSSESFSVFAKSIELEKINATILWRIDREGESNNTPMDKIIDPFTQIRFSRLGASIDGWYGPALRPDGTFGSFIAISFKKSWWRYSKQKMILHDILLLLKRNDMQKIEINDSSCDDLFAQLK